MKRIPLSIQLFVALVVFLLVTPQFYCASPDKQEAKATETVAKADDPVMDKIRKGGALVHIGGCNDCHTPKLMTAMGPVPDTTKILSGHPANSPLPPITYDATKPGNWILMAPDLTAFVGPWGISYAANLTPDSTTGTGAWTSENFINTMRTGKHLGLAGGRPILPPMPWETVGKLNNEELESIFLYLHSLPAISNAVPPVVPPNMVSKVK